MVQKLGLKVSKCPSIIKAVNSEAKLIFGIDYGVNFKVDKWTRKGSWMTSMLFWGMNFFCGIKGSLVGGQWVGKSA